MYEYSYQGREMCWRYCYGHQMQEKTTFSFVDLAEGGFPPHDTILQDLSPVIGNNHKIKVWCSSS